MARQLFLHRTSLLRRAVAGIAAISVLFGCYAASARSTPEREAAKIAREQKQKDIAAAKAAAIEAKAEAEAARAEADAARAEATATRAEADAIRAEAQVKAAEKAAKPDKSRKSKEDKAATPAKDKPAADPKNEPEPTAQNPKPQNNKPRAEIKADEPLGPKPADVWAPDVVAAAKARCDVILKKINAVAISQTPLKEGACGAPAPIQLISIGKNPQVSISPPAVVTCELAEALSTWLENDLQPLAKRHLNAEIIKIETMSGYACRNAYGRATNKLSEHGVANALDIRGFVTASAKTAYVLEDWGKPQREIIAELAAAKAAAAKAESQRLAAEKAAQTNQVTAKSGADPLPAKTTPPGSTATTAGQPASGIARSTITDGLPKMTVTLPGGKTEPKPEVGFAEPDKLGGPKPSEISGPFGKGPLDNGLSSKSPVTKIAATAKPEPQPALRKSQFLHAAHNSACEIFGTTLGPEANAAHRNHFHVDMAPRRATKICE